MSPVVDNASISRMRALWGLRSSPATRLLSRKQRRGATRPLAARLHCTMTTPDFAARSNAARCSRGRAPGRQSPEDAAQRDVQGPPPANGVSGLPARGRASDRYRIPFKQHWYRRALHPFDPGPAEQPGRPRNQHGDQQEVGGDVAKAAAEVRVEVAGA